MNKILIFIFLFLAIVGLIGGIGYTVYEKAYVLVFGLLALGYLVMPKFLGLFWKMMD